jgi:hypothetical protein
MMEPGIVMAADNITNAQKGVRLPVQFAAVEGFIGRPVKSVVKF